MRDLEGGRATRGEHGAEPAHEPVPGKRTLADSLPAVTAPVQRKAATAPAPVGPAGSGRTLHELFPGVQRQAAGGEQDPAAVHAQAQRGIATPASPLPHGETIQRLFGRHDISGIQAHVGPDAASSARAMGADAYAAGNHVVLGAGTDLHTVAHEAAHVVQQRGGVQLKGGVGDAGDAYEQHADEVADAVVRGDSAEHMLDAAPGGSSPAIDDDADEQPAEMAGEDAAEEAGEDAAAGEEAAVDDAHAGDDAAASHAAAPPGAHADAGPGAGRSSPAAAGTAVQMARTKGRRGRGRRAQPRGGRWRQPDHGRIKKPRGHVPDRSTLPRERKTSAILLRLSTLKDEELAGELRGMSRRQFKNLLHFVTPQDRVKYGDLLSRLKLLRVAITAQGLEGSLYWSGPSSPDKNGRPKTDTGDGPNQFAIWLRGGQQPTDESGMNCWEMVLYSAHQAGAVTKDWILKVHERAATAYQSKGGGAKQKAYYEAIEHALNYPGAQPVEKGVPIPKGHIVFFDGIDHVAISQGTLNDQKQHEILSLWCMPKNNKTVQSTTTERVTQAELSVGWNAPTVLHAKPLWS